MELSPEFAALGVAEPFLRALSDLDYHQPSPIQQQCIPLLLQGGNVLGTAQTGTGKTAAFALPLLERIDAAKRHPQLLVLAPTRELAVQVAEAIKGFARYLPQIKVLAVYGGQPMYQQLKALHDGVQVVVGTPGRIMDHMRRGSLKLERIDAVVLDEADEMLRMGFIDDVETILAATPPKCQCALFSATMPPAIRRVAEKYLGDASEVQIASRTATVDQIEQGYLLMRGNQKFDVLCRILEAEDHAGVIIFVRTKNATSEIAQKLEARGHRVAALNGDLSQQMRENTIDRLKRGGIDIVVATDVAARGLDVERISHVFNYDIPFDTEAYIHRIGRTGRAGRSGRAILFVCPPERRLLKIIERAIKRQIPLLPVPSAEQISARRVQRFREQLHTTMRDNNLEQLRELIETIAAEDGLDIGAIAAALAQQLHRNTPLFPILPDINLPVAGEQRQRRERGGRQLGVAMSRYRLAVGRKHSVTAGDIVGAFTNEGRVPMRAIGRINVFGGHSTVELARDLPPRTLEKLRDIKLRQCAIDIKRMAADDADYGKKVPGRSGKPVKKKGGAKPFVPRRHR